MASSPTLSTLAERLAGEGGFISPGAELGAAGAAEGAANFYVRPNGDIIPAEGYRYISSDAPYINELMESGRIPGGGGDTYFSFDKYSSATEARDALQLPRSNNAQYRVEFDTGQVLDDVRIPNENYGRGPNLEPRCNSMDPDIYGSGGGTQAVTNCPIQATRIVDLNTGRIVYGIR